MVLVSAAKAEPQKFNVLRAKAPPMSLSADRRSIRVLPGVLGPPTWLAPRDAQMPHGDEFHKITHIKKVNRNAGSFSRPRPTARQARQNSPFQG
jgi:hypothetical protein